MGQQTTCCLCFFFPLFADMRTYKYNEACFEFEFDFLIVIIIRQPSKTLFAQRRLPTGVFVIVAPHLPNLIFENLQKISVKEMRWDKTKKERE